MRAKDFPLLHVGWNKKGEMDFGVSAVVGDLEGQELQDFRIMLLTAMYVAEDMWRRGSEKRTPATMADVTPKEEVSGDE